MRLSKRQLKRIIREEYSRLKRRGLLREAAEWQHNPNMEPQDCPEGTTIEECADGWAQYIADMDYNVFYHIKSDWTYPGGIGYMLTEAGEEEGALLSECLEGMDIEGSGNWNYDDAVVALFHAIKRLTPRDNRND